MGRSGVVAVAFAALFLHALANPPPNGWYCHGDDPAPYNYFSESDSTQWTVAAVVSSIEANYVVAACSRSMPERCAPHCATCSFFGLIVLERSVTLTLSLLSELGCKEAPYNCTGTAPEDRICTIASPELQILDLSAAPRSPQQCVFSFPGRIVFDGVHMKRKNGCDVGGVGTECPQDCGCDFVVEAAVSIEVKGGSRLTFPSMNLTAPTIMIDEASSVDASGLGPLFSHESCDLSGRGGGGGGHAGWGGVASNLPDSCSPADGLPSPPVPGKPTEGVSFEHPWFYGGSGGGFRVNAARSEQLTRGGGRIFIGASQLVLKGELAARGFSPNATNMQPTGSAPEVSVAGGGAGGSLWVEAQEVVVSPGHVLSVAGGSSTMGGGGSGGVIALYADGDAMADTLEYNVSGGRRLLTSGPCGAGAEGLIFWASSGVLNCGYRVPGTAAGGLSGLQVAATQIQLDEGHGSLDVFARSCNVSFTNSPVEVNIFQTWDSHISTLPPMLRSAGDLLFEQGSLVAERVDDTRLDSSYVVLLEASGKLELNDGSKILMPSLNVTAATVNVSDVDSAIDATGLGPLSSEHLAAIYKGKSGAGGGHAGVGGRAWGDSASCRGSAYSPQPGTPPPSGVSAQLPWDPGYGGPGGGSSPFTPGLRGGGRIFLKAELLLLTGRLAADGASYPPATAAEQLHPVHSTGPLVFGGGAGGSLWVNVTSLEIPVGITPQLSVKGGDTGYGGGGSGGVLAVYTKAPDSQFTDLFNVDGGRHTGFVCGHGAPGIFFSKQDKLISCGGGSGRIEPNSGAQLVAPTLVELDNLVNDVNLKMRYCMIDLKDHDVVSLASVTATSSLIIPPRRLELSGSFQLSQYSYVHRIARNPSNMTVLAGSISLDRSIISFEATGSALSLRLTLNATGSSGSGALVVDKQSFIHFAHQALLAGKQIVVQNDVSETDLALNTELMFFATEKISVDLASNVAADAVALVAPAIEARGTITASGEVQERCQHEVPIRKCATLDPEQFFTRPGNAASTLPRLISLHVHTGSLDIAASGSLQGGATGVCATRVDVYGSIDASQYGCGATKGPGAGSDGNGVTAYPGGGGGHGGKGGFGANSHGPGGVVYDVANVTTPFGEPTMLGSGGGGAGYGGSGGGLIHIVASELSLQGEIKANGGPGLSGVSASENSGGGGSGGTIVLRLGSFVAIGSKAQISATGGAGGSAAGGGGGGVLALRWSGVPNATATQGAVITQVVSNVGGAKGLRTNSYDAEAGADGVSGAYPGCPPGRDGLFCRPCAPGKASSAEESCTKCPLGKFTALSGQTHCTQCPDGTVSALLGATRCVHCSLTGPGHWSNVDNTACNRCAAGWETNENRTSSDEAQCFRCATGKYSPTVGDRCQKCPPGNSSVGPDDTPSHCPGCAPGTVAKDSGMATCTPCGEGQISDDTRTSCSSCTDTEGIVAPDRCAPCQQNFAVQEHSGGRCEGCSTAGTYAIGGQSWKEYHGCRTCPVTDDHSSWKYPGTMYNLSMEERCKRQCFPGYSLVDGLGTTECLSPEGIAIAGLGGNIVCIALLVLGFGAVFVPEVMRRSRRERPRHSRARGRGGKKHRGEAEMTGVSGMRHGGLRGDAAAAGYAPLADWGAASLAQEAGGRGRRRRRGRGKVKKARTADLKRTLAMRASDLHWHVHRVYLDGRGSPHHPLNLAMDAPPELSTLVRPEQFAEYAGALNESVRWPSAARTWHRILRYLNYPLSSMYANRQRLRSASQLLVYHHDYDHAFLKDTRARALGTSLKMAISHDGTLAWMDVLAEQGEDTGGVPVGQPRTPLVLCCMGDGSFLTPWQLDLSDPLVVAAGQMLGSDWRDILLYFNSIMRTVPRGNIIGSREIMPVQSFLSVTNEEKAMQDAAAPMLYLGITEPQSNFPRVALLFLPREVAVGPNGSYPYHLPYRTKVVPVKKVKSRIRCGRWLLWFVSFAVRNVKNRQIAGATGLLLGVLVILDLELGLLLNSWLRVVYVEGFLATLLVPPLAWLLAPLLGIYAQLSDSSDAFRLYAHLNQLSFLSALACLVALWVRAATYNPSASSIEIRPDDLSLTYPAVWVVVKLLTAAFVNLQAAYVDGLRDEALLDVVPRMAGGRSNGRAAARFESTDVSSSGAPDTPLLAGLSADGGAFGEEERAGYSRRDSYNSDSEESQDSADSGSSDDLRHASLPSASYIPAGLDDVMSD